MNLLKKDYEYHKIKNVPIGCLLVYEKNNTFYQNNLYLTQWNGPSTIDHAELLIIQKALLLSWDLNKCTLFVSCEPCIMCAGAIGLSKIKRIVFGCENFTKGGLYKNNVLYWNNLYKTEIIGGIMDDYWSTILKQFFLNKRI